MLINPSEDSPIKNINNVGQQATVKLGNQSFLALLDTGSADIWFVGSDFKCTSKSASSCNFRTTYKTTESFRPITDRKMDISYDTGERLQGKMGLEKVTLGGVTVPNAIVGIIHTGQWRGDGSSSGMLGMSAFSSDTRAYALNYDPSKTPNNPFIPYEPLLANMHKQGLTAPYFSIALNRQNESPGVLALGGLPGASIRYENASTSAKFEYLIFKDGSINTPGNFKKEYSLYLIKPTGFTAGSRTIKMTVTAAVDTGSPINFVPPEVSEAVNRGWSPRATFDRRTALWNVNCDATPPEFGININGTKFVVAKEDMVVKGGAGTLPSISESGKCFSTVQSSGVVDYGLQILGTPFLKNVVAVFDIGAAEMRFLKRIR
jgi:hypothetical protein